MTEGKKIIKNSFYLLIARIINMMGSAFIGIFVARYLGKIGYGKYTSAVVFINFLITFTDIGIDMLFLREGSRDHKLVRQYLGNTFLIKGILTSINLILIFSLPYVFGYDKEIVSLIYILALGYLAPMITNTCYVHMQIRDKLQIGAVYQVISNIVTVGIVAYVIYFKVNLVDFCIMQTVGMVVTSSLYIFYSLKLDKPAYNTKKLTSMIKACYIFGISSMLYIIYYKINSLMLSIIKGPVQVGIYEAACRILNIILMSLVVLDNAVMPIMYRLYKQDIEKMKSLYRKMMKYMIMIGLPISVGSVLTSKYIINFIYTNEFNEASVVFSILACAIVFRFAAVVSGFVLTATDNMHKKVKFQLLFTIVNLILNSAMIPFYGYVGASIATVITEMTVFIAYYIFVKKNYSKGMEIKDLFKIVLATIIMSFVIIMSLDKVNIFVTIAVGGITYFLGILILFGLREFQELLLYKKNV